MEKNCHTSSYMGQCNPALLTGYDPVVSLDFCDPSYHYNNCTITRWAMCGIFCKYIHYSTLPPNLCSYTSELSCSRLILRPPRDSSILVATRLIAPLLTGCSVAFFASVYTTADFYFPRSLSLRLVQERSGKTGQGKVTEQKI